MRSDVTRTPMQLCPHCGYEVNAHGPTGTDSTPPTEGDLCVCLACAGVLRYGPKLIMVATTIDDPDIEEGNRAEMKEAIWKIKALRQLDLNWPRPYRGRGNA